MIRFVVLKTLVLILAFTLASCQERHEDKMKVQRALLERQGFSKLTKGDYQGAIPFFEQIREIEPDSRQNLARLSGLYSKVRNHPKAIEIYKELLKYKPNYDIYLAIGLSYEALGENEKANDYFELGLKETSQLIHASRADVNVYGFRGTYYYLLGKRKEALSDFRYVAENKIYHPVEYDLWNGMLQSLEENGTRPKCIILDFCDPTSPKYINRPNL